MASIRKKIDLLRQAKSHRNLSQTKIAKPSVFDNPYDSQSMGLKRCSNFSSRKVSLSNSLSTIRDKLKGTWKQIFRLVSSSDVSSGEVTQQGFNDALMFTNTFLSNEEVRQLIKHFGDGKSKLDYMRVSNELIGFDSALKSQ